MMLDMLNAQTSIAETPIGDQLPLRVKTILERNGIHTIEGVRSAYPNELLKMRGMGMFRFKQIETALFPGKSFIPARIYSPVRHIKGSSLNGVFAPETVQALARGGITTVEQLLAREPKVLLKIRGLGIHKLREIEDTIHERKKD
ncbi:DNA-directed RNA polymerase subunit alpha C-terminal domain-containing protein [Comamonas sp. B21-038]|uniref:DNA-directed RNA polymerase subunit alpha C-terminal domain-containing protein n=1 Tax=Comamonas sp. B21-038 TaxID=2918299 RepID=UPI001EFAFCC7|nr:DNA-directed RNA polymerase subunit alpha C-terminal domain-containing protein [Comamonas sp. B21-038]ULR89743.1 helix-hairpin-helix domain-containing protein [Comamonas sp. B21-038]